MINIKNLTKYYDTTCALNHVNFEVKKGEILGLLGPNGAGKSTTLRILTGFLPPTSGTVTVKDFDINEQPLEIKKLIGYLPESAPLYPDMLAYDYLLYIAQMRDIPKEKREKRLKEIADLCSLNNVMHKPIHTLSKGYKQRVGLGHAMMSDPEILVLDEPTEGLDPNQIVEIRNIIKKIGKEKTVIVSSHILSEVEATCNRVVIINQGKVVADDTTDTLKHTAGKGQIILMELADAGFADVKQHLSGLSGIQDMNEMPSQDKNLHLQIVCKEDIRASLYNKIKEKNWVLLEMQRKSQTLENIFRELTKEN